MSALPTSPVFVDVILPVPLNRLFTYEVPADLIDSLAHGKRVIVQFGQRKYYSAIIFSIHSHQPEQYKTKEIIAVLDDKPVVNSFQLKFWEWIASYYMCSLGDIMKAALPAGLKLESETRVTLNTEFVANRKLTDAEDTILTLFSGKTTLSIDDISKTYKKKDILKVIKKLVDEDALMLEEALKYKHAPRTETLVELTPHLRNEQALKDAMDQVQRIQRQIQILMNYVKLSGIFTEVTREVTRKELISYIPSGRQALNALIKKNIFRTSLKIISSQSEPNPTGSMLKELSPAQQKAMEEIKLSFEKFPVVLLHGYTASGKTELYIHLIEEQLKKGKQVLYLLPEIALTAQIINRLKNAFGDKVGVYHSKFSYSERVQVWQGMMDDKEKHKYQVILGVRSSVFLPFDNLGLVIVDEEHENTYKQFDPAPRYHARDAAIVLAQMFQAKTLLGTATPSIESYFNAENKKYGLVELFERYKNIQLPQITIANTAEAKEKKAMNSHFHPVLVQAIREALEQDEQVILFQNRRGYAPYLQCGNCSSIPKCKNCDVSLTYHRNLNTLVCHYCGYSSSKINRCDSCGSEHMIMHGFGTQKIEDELSLFFPGRIAARMDVDSTRSRKAYEELISEFENHEIDILVGTQMITKGLDFDNVSLVGVLDADHLLNFPDFRAYERSFQLISQVSGRAGRKNKQGKVIVQTSDPSNYVIQDVIRNDFQHTYRIQLSERSNFGYPPYTRLIQITLKHKSQELLNQAADYLTINLRKSFGNRIYGPESPLIGRINNWFLKNILIKIERQASVIKAKELIARELQTLNAHEQFRSVVIQPDVDPM